MSALFFIGCYFAIAVVVGAIGTYAISREFSNDRPEGEDYAMGAFLGMIWPVVLPFGLLAWVVYRFYQWVARTFAPKDPVDK